MRSGIKKEEILGMLTDMALSLEETDVSLHENLLEKRETMCKSHSSQLAETSILLDRVEGKLPQPPRPALETQSSLKLELSF